MDGVNYATNAATLDGMVWQDKLRGHRMDTGESQKQAQIDPLPELSF
jgi:hypothetical protein